MFASSSRLVVSLLMAVSLAACRGDSANRGMNSAPPGGSLPPGTAARTPAGAADGSAAPSTSAAVPDTTPAAAECPFATAKAVSDAMGRPMHVTLRSSTACEWVSDTDTAVGATVRLVGAEEFEHTNMTPVSGLGDEAYATPVRLLFRANGKIYEIEAGDSNSRGSVDVAAANRKIAEVVVH